MPWGTHVCVFYEAKRDALDTLIPYFRVGLENQERCIWAVSDPIAEDDARTALMQPIPDALADGGIEILPGDEWYLAGLDHGMEAIVRGWEQKLASAVAAGHEELRISGNALWLQSSQWDAFTEYEHEVPSPSRFGIRAFSMPSRRPWRATAPFWRKKGPWRICSGIGRG